MVGQNCSPAEIAALPCGSWRAHRALISPARLERGQGVRGLPLQGGAAVVTGCHRAGGCVPLASGGATEVLQEAFFCCALRGCRRKTEPGAPSMLPLRAPDGERHAVPRGVLVMVPGCAMAAAVMGPALQPSQGYHLPQALVST